MSATQAMAQVRRFDGHSDRITDLQVSEDCAWLLSSAMDGTLRVWDIPAATTFQVHHAWRSSVVLQSAAVPMAAVAARKYSMIFLRSNRSCNDMPSRSSTPNQRKQVYASRHVRDR